jgi:hypothetical protein
VATFCDGCRGDLQKRHLPTKIPIRKLFREFQSQEKLAQGGSMMSLKQILKEQNHSMDAELLRCERTLNQMADDYSVAGEVHLRPRWYSPSYVWEIHEINPPAWIGTVTLGSSEIMQLRGMTHQALRDLLEVKFLAAMRKLAHLETA